jgi:hypothetical protein
MMACNAITLKPKSMKFKIDFNSFDVNIKIIIKTLKNNEIDVFL